MLRRYARGDASYIYCDTRLEVGFNQYQIHTANDYVQRDFFRKGRNTQAVLMATEHARQVGGFDESLIAWEDWDFFIRCAINGITGARIPEALLTYRKHLGTRSDAGHAIKDQLWTELLARYQKYSTGAKEMCQGCGAAKAAQDALAKSRTMQARVDTLDKPVPAGHTRLKYTGARQSPLVFTANGRKYTAGATDKWRYIDALDEDVERLMSMDVFMRAPIKLPVAAVEPPKVEPVKVEPPKPPITTVIPTLPTPRPTVTQEQMDKALAMLEGRPVETVTTAKASTTIIETPHKEFAIKEEIPDVDAKPIVIKRRGKKRG